MPNIGKVNFKHIVHEGIIWKITQNQLNRFNKKRDQGLPAEMKNFGRYIGRFDGHLK